MFASQFLCKENILSVFEKSQRKFYIKKSLTTFTFCYRTEAIQLQIVKIKIKIAQTCLTFDLYVRGGQGWAVRRLKCFEGTRGHFARPITTH